jgi:uncharacterized protein YegL
MKNNYSDLTLVLDRSGSMSSIAEETIAGFNEFVDNQKRLPVEAFFSLVQFDDVYELVHDGIPIQDVPLLDNHTFVPRGSTALLDAIGKTIDDVGKRLASLDEDQRPEKVVVVIITDGQENSSTQYNLSDINEKISHQRNAYKWEFLFLGANQDAIATAVNVGIRSTSALTYAATPEGTTSAFRSTSRSVGLFTEGGSEFAEFDASDLQDLGNPEQ